MTAPFIEAAGLVKIHKVAEIEVVALQGLDLSVAAGEFVALVGPSGAGKSTLLAALGGLDRPSAGRLRVGETDLLALGPRQLSAYRQREVGFVWQQTARNLLPYLSARQNVELLMTLAGRPARERRAWAAELLDAVGMAEHAERTPGELSGGQQQRAALACALANRPRILLGDEPTGEVDWASAERILALLDSLRARYGVTVVVVTHDERVAERADRVVAIRDGRVSGERRPCPAAHAPPAAQRPASGQEQAVLDAAGRLQLPAELRHLAGLGRRARLELTPEGVLVRPGDGDGPQGQAPAEPEDDPAGLARALYE